MGYTGGDLFSAIVVSILVTGALASLIAYYCGMQDVQQKAVKADVAEYIPGKNGEPVFSWKNGSRYDDDCDTTSSTGPG